MSMVGHFLESKVLYPCVLCVLVAIESIGCSRTTCPERSQLLYQEDTQAECRR